MFKNMTKQEEANVKKGWRQLLALVVALVLVPIAAIAALWILAIIAMILYYPYPHH